jgi:putative ABC transport system ATP-binding protein
MSEVVFEAHGLTKVYRNGEIEVRALAGVDLTLYAGELVVLLGPSGSGKSTLLNILGGLDHASSGFARFRDQELTSLDDDGLTAYRRDHVGFVFQFYNLIPSLTARENVALVTEIARDPMAPEVALDLVGLAQRMDHFPAQMSGGEQQRVAIARAIAKRPTSSCATSPRERWTAKPASACSRRCRSSTRSLPPPPRSSRTTPPSGTWRIACSCSATGASPART